jgi:hypothetical protein
MSGGNIMKALIEVAEACEIGWRLRNEENHHPESQ